MKLFFSLFVLQAVAFMSQVAGAAVPETSLGEILSMPSQNRQAVALAQKDPNFYKSLLRMAFNKTESFQNRWKSLALAGQLGGAPASVDIQRACGESEWFMKNACLLILEKINPVKAKAIAQDLLSDRALVVRAAAARILSQNPSLLVRERLWQELAKPYNFRKKQSLWIRSIILEGLAKNPMKQEQWRFASALRESDTRLHLYAIRGLEKILNKKLATKGASLAEARNFWLKLTSKAL